jgi:hypothetical protein
MIQPRGGFRARGVSRSSRLLSFAGAATLHALASERTAILFLKHRSNPFDCSEEGDAEGVLYDGLKGRRGSRLDGRMQ